MKRSYIQIRRNRYCKPLEKQFSWQAISTAIAGFALITGFITVYLTQQHNKQSVRPLLTAWHADNPIQGTVSWYVSNAGLGPAIITEAKVFIGYEEAKGHMSYTPLWENVKNKFSDDVDVRPNWNEVVIKGDVLKNGSTFEAVTIKWDSVDSYSKHAGNPIELDAKLIIAYCYCSVYEECQYTDSRNDIGLGKSPLILCNDK